MLVGANDSDWSSLQTAMQAVNSKARVQIIRRYDGSFPSAFSSSSAQQDVGLRATWLSFSSPSVANVLSGAADATIASFFASVPSSHRLLVTWIHEVDNNKLGSSTAQDYAAGVSRIWSLKQANAQNPANVSFGPILMGTTYYTGQNYANYYPTDGHFDFVGIDPYRFVRDASDPYYLPDPKTGGTGTARTMAYLCGNAPALCSQYSKPIAFGEYGAHPFTSNHQVRPQWLSETDAFMRNLPNGTMASCYFHAKYGESGPWYVDRFHHYTTDASDPLRVGTPGDDPDSLAVFASIAATGQ